LTEEQSVDDYNNGALGRLLAPGIKLILIKGAPGTGKTSLATKLLELVRSGTYISTRVGLEKLAKQSARLRAMDKGGRLQRVSLESRKVDLEDMRLGTAALAMQQVIAASLAKKELIVLDSWDTIAKEVDRTERLRMEKTIAAIVDEGASRAIFISEEPELTSTDYLVDAIVTLTRSDLEARRLREIAWEKIRGQAAPARRSLFTLDEGRFVLIPPPFISPPDPQGLRKPPLSRTRERFEVIPHTSTRLSTGSRDLDEFLGGGLTRGMSILLEKGPTVGNDWIAPLVSSVQANVLLDGGSCIAVPPMVVSSRSLLEGTQALVGDEVTRSRMRIMSYAATTFKHPSIVDLSRAKRGETYQLQQDTATKVKQEEAPTLWVLSIDTYETYADPERGATASYFARGSQARRETGDVGILIANPNAGSLQTLSNNCDVHLMLEEKDGALLLYSKRPPSDLYSVNYDYSKGYPRVSLKQMV
jgi:KaiC/GvpD/RAD55 family RecA-like ATPase